MPVRHLLGTCTLAGVPAASAPLPPPAEIDAEVAAFYRARHFRPLWLEGSALKPAARTVLAMAGNDPRIAAALAAAETAIRRALTRADLLLSRAFADRARARFQRRPMPIRCATSIPASPPPRADAPKCSTRRRITPSLAAHVDAVAAAQSRHRRAAARARRLSGALVAPAAGQASAQHPPLNNSAAGSAARSARVPARPRPAGHRPRRSRHRSPRSTAAPPITSG